MRNVHPFDRPGLKVLNGVFLSLAAADVDMPGKNKIIAEVGSELALDCNLVQLGENVQDGVRLTDGLQNAGRFVKGRVIPDDTLAGAFDNRGLGNLFDFLGIRLTF